MEDWMEKDRENEKNKYNKEHMYWLPSQWSPKRIVRTLENMYQK